MFKGQSQAQYPQNDSIYRPSRKEKYPQTYQRRGQHCQCGGWSELRVSMLTVVVAMGTSGCQKLPTVHHCQWLHFCLQTKSSQSWFTVKTTSKQHHTHLVGGSLLGGYNKKKWKSVHLYEEKHRYISSSRWVRILNSKSGSTQKIECAERLRFWNQSRDWRSHRTEGKTPLSSVNSFMTTSCSNSQPSRRLLVSHRPRAHMGDGSHLPAHRDLRPAVFYGTICRGKQTGPDLRRHLSGLARASEKRAGWPKCAHDL